MIIKAAYYFNDTISGLLKFSFYCDEKLYSESTEYMFCKYIHGQMFCILYYLMAHFKNLSPNISKLYRWLFLMTKWHTFFFIQTNNK